MNSARYLLIFGVILALLCGIVPVSADEIYNEVFTEYDDFEYHLIKTTESLSVAENNYGVIVIYPVENFKDCIISGVETTFPRHYTEMTASSEGDYVDIWYVGTKASGSDLLTHCGVGYYGYFKYTSDGTPYTKSYLHSDNFTIPANVSDGSGHFKLIPKTKSYSQLFGDPRKNYYTEAATTEPYGAFRTSTVSDGMVMGKSTNSLYVKTAWINQLIVNDDGTIFQINLVRNNYRSVFRINTEDLAIYINDDSSNQTVQFPKSFAPLYISVQNVNTGNWFNNTIGITPTPTPTPIPEPELTYIAKIEARDYHTNEILPDVHFLISDFKKSETLYNQWVSAGFIEVPLEHRSYDDSHFPRQYGIRASKQGYYAEDIIVSHWIKPYTFIIRMRDIYSEEPLDTSLITFHIRDRFSNNYIDTARLIITHYNDGEVYNQTVNGGKQSVRLPQTQPYDPQFDYNATVKADNYVDAVIGFSVYNDVDINIKMFPGEGTPGEGNAFIHFTVGYFDNNNIFRNIPGAKITIGAQSVYTNTAGYAQFELPDNDFYTYTAEHFEFETVSGSIMLQGSRTHTIIMHRRDVPTTPTAQPTFPGEELVDESYLDWMARNFAKAFNLSLEGGKLFMGMIISLAIGMITAKKLNGGAAEFGIGMLGGMVLCILIGILPLWPIIALLLIVGLYIGMQIARGDKQGGR